MPHRPSRKPSILGHLLAMACLLSGGWLHNQSASAVDILLTGVDDSPGVQSFVQALVQMRPADNVHFQPLASLPPPGKLAADTRLILLDLPSLDWRLQDPRGPATLVLRISRLQARQHLGHALPPHPQPALERSATGPALRLTRVLLPWPSGLASCTTAIASSCCGNCARPPIPGS